MFQAKPQLNLASSDKAMAVKSEVSFVTAIGYSPDGKYLTSGGAKTTASVWDLENAKEAMKINIPIPDVTTGFVSDVLYSPNGKTIAISARTGVFSGDATQLVEAQSGRELRTISVPLGGTLSFSPEGKQLLGEEFTLHFFRGTSTNIIKLVDVQTGEAIKEFNGFRHGCLAPDGTRAVLIANDVEDRQTDVVLMDLETGRKIWQRQDDSVSAVAFSPDGKTILLGSYKHETAGLGFKYDIYFRLLDSSTGNQISEFDHVNFSTSTPFGDPGVRQNLIRNITFSPNAQYVVSSGENGEYKLWETATGKMVRKLKRPDETIVFGISSYHSAFSPNGKVVAIASAASTRLYDVKSGDEVAALIAFDDGEWLITTPDGYYNASEKGDQYLDVSVAGKPYTISQLRESFYRPDLVKIALSGQQLEGLKNIADIKPPPSISIINTPASVSSDQITVSLEVRDQGGGIGDVRLYLNDTAVVLDRSSRALSLKTEAPNSARILTYPLNLVSGRNSLRAIAFNADNTMQSTDALHEIDAKIAVRKPALHALVVGIQEYENPKLTLKYPVADANLFADTLKERAAGLFDAVTITRLTTRQETTSASITAALKKMRAQVGPNDLFVFYVASHGTVDDGEYFLITSNVGATSTEKLKRDALSQNNLKELLSNIPAAKKLIVLDTCNAGKLGDAIQVAMLTRGMSEDTAFKVLSRAVGSTILSAANSQQEALEGYRDHGLFTYVISEGLQGKADLDKDGFVKTTELANYIEDEVPDLAEKIFKHKQYPVASPSGQGFPVARMR
jgi:WD40 repeat protein